MLVDYIIPRDEKSGSATDAKVPEYMDYLLAEKDANVITGSYVRLSTDELSEADGNPVSARMYQVVKRDRNVAKGQITLTMIQVSQRRLAVVAPAGHPAYPSASEADRAYGYLSDQYGRMSDGSEGYYIW